MCCPFILISKCKCGPVEFPVLPTAAIMSPAWIFCPTFTYILLVCPYHVSTPLPCEIIILSFVYLVNRFFNIQILLYIFAVFVVLFLDILNSHAIIFSNDNVVVPFILSFFIIEKYLYYFSSALFLLNNLILYSMSIKNINLYER